MFCNSLLTVVNLKMIGKILVRHFYDFWFDLNKEFIIMNDQHLYAYLAEAPSPTD